MDCELRMVKVYFEHIVDIEPLKKKKIAVIGYGNQEHSQPLNIRDSRLDVIIGLNLNYSYRPKGQLEA